ncbi:hypothetical protein TNCV_4249221 [Trichonephila clavipes]|nr:hypothetical protein TNCV_4249221 [Trichonephila clavipes]
MERCVLKLSRAQTSFRWCGVVVRRGCASSGVVLVIWPWFKITRSITKSTHVAERGEIDIRSLTHLTSVELSQKAPEGPPIKTYKNNYIIYLTQIVNSNEQNFKVGDEPKDLPSS